MDVHCSQHVWLLGSQHSDGGIPRKMAMSSIGGNCAIFCYHGPGVLHIRWQWKNECHIECLQMICSKLCHRCGRSLYEAYLSFSRSSVSSVTRLLALLESTAEVPHQPVDNTQIVYLLILIVSVFRQDYTKQLH